MVAFKVSKPAKQFENTYRLNGEFNPYIPTYIRESLEKVQNEIDEITNNHPLIDNYLCRYRNSNDELLSAEARSDIQKILS